MYSPGDTLYLVSQNLSGSDLLDVNLADVHALLHSPGRIVATEKPAHVSGQRPPLVYQMCITHAYTPFTMSVVCRAKLTGVYKGPAALAPFIPLPPDTSDATPLAIESPSDVVGGTASIGPEYILKLYDHRCFVNARTEGKEVLPYARENARAYHKYHQGPPAPYFSKYFSSMPGLSHQRPPTESDLGIFEAWMEADARSIFETEVSVYNVLADLQGSAVPRLFDTISSNTPFVFNDPPSMAGVGYDNQVTPMRGKLDQDDRAHRSNHDDVAPNGVDLTHLAAGHPIYGLLLEYVPGISLRSFIGSSLRAGRQELRAHVASIADEAVALVLKIGRYPVLNRDIRLENMLVRQSYVATLSLDGMELGSGDEQLTESDPSSVPHSVSFEELTDSNPAATTVSRCVSIDFGQARLRFDDETDEQWRCAKLYDDEEYAITDRLSWEMQRVFKEIIGAEQSFEGDAATLRTLARDAQAALWSYELKRPWYRKLSMEDQLAYESDDRWGQHPDN